MKKQTCCLTRLGDKVMSISFFLKSETEKTHFLLDQLQPSVCDSDRYDVIPIFYGEAWTLRRCRQKNKDLNRCTHYMQTLLANFPRLRPVRLLLQMGGVLCWKSSHLVWSGPPRWPRWSCWEPVCGHEHSWSLCAPATSWTNRWAGEEKEGVWGRGGSVNMAGNELKVNTMSKTRHASGCRAGSWRGSDPQEQQTELSPNVRIWWISFL